MGFLFFQRTVYEGMVESDSGGGGRKSFAFKRKGQMEVILKIFSFSLMQESRFH